MSIYTVAPATVKGEDAVGTTAELGDAAMVDRAWRGYDPRAGFPTAAAAAFASVILLAGRWAFDVHSRFTEQAGALAIYAMALAVWPGLLTTLIYRTITYTYRITDRAVLIDWGFRNLPEPAVGYSDLTGVSVETHWIGRRLGFGQVTLTAKDGRVVVLQGVANPTAFADAIRGAAEKFKASAGTDRETASTSGPR